MAAVFIAGCGDPNGPIIKPAERGLEVSPTQIRTVLGQIQTAVNAAELAASAAAPKIFVDRTLEQSSYLCVDAGRGPVQMDYTTKGQFKRTLSDGSSEIGFRFESYDGMNRLTGVQYGNTEPSFYKTSRSDGQSAEVWSDAKTGKPSKRCFRSIGKEYLWFDPKLISATKMLSTGSWRCGGALDYLGEFSLNMAGRSSLASGGAAQWFIWSEKQTYRIDIFQSPQSWPDQPDPSQGSLQVQAPISNSMTFTSVAEYTIDLSELNGGKWSFTGASGNAGACTRVR